MEGRGRDPSSAYPIQVFFSTPLAHLAPHAGPFLPPHSNCPGTWTPG